MNARIIFHPFEVLFSCHDSWLNYLFSQFWFLFFPNFPFNKFRQEQQVYENMVKAYSWKFFWVILKVLVRISLLWFTKLLVEVWNVENGQTKTTYNNVPKHYKWGEKDKIDSQWTSCSKAIGCRQTKEVSCWPGKKGCSCNIIFTRDKKRGWGTYYRGEATKEERIVTYKEWWKAIKEKRILDKLVSSSFVTSHCYYKKKKTW